MELSVLCTVQGTVAATAVEGALKEAGIPSTTRGSGNAAWLFPGASGGLGFVDVLVPADALDEARRVLHEVEEDASS